MTKLRLTYPQQNIWLVEKVNKDLPINSIVGTIEINEKFDEKICNDAINYVIKNNDAMRINIVSIDDQTYQTVREFEYEYFEVVNLSLNSESEIKEYVNDCVLLPLFLDKNKLFEFKIFNYGNGKGSIFMKIHHIISDAWSCSKIGTQLIEYMQAKLNDEEIVDELKPSYVEFVEKEIEYENSEKYLKDEEFWNEYLKGTKEALTIKNVTTSITKSAARYSVKLTDEENNLINNYCKENKISPYALFLTALSTYLYRIKDNNDFIIGTPVLNRSNFREKNTVGMFVSTIPLRIKIKEKEKFIELAKSISTNTLTLFRHQKYPYAKMLENVYKNTDLKSNLYKVALSYQNARTNVINEKVYSTSWIFNGYLEEQLQIHIMDMDNTGMLNINYDYLIELFSKEEIKYLHTRIMAIIQNAIDDIGIDVENINIMSVEEKNKILYEFNATDAEYPKNKTVIELFEEQVEKNPDKVAIVFEDKEMTYKELNEKANNLAYYLRNEKDIKAKDIVAVAVDKSFELYVCILAILKADGVYLPIDINLPNDRITYMLENCNCNLTLVNKEQEGIKNSLNINNINFKNNSKNLKHYSKFDDLVYVMYTSGSTGKPKGASMYNYNVVKLVKNINYFDMNQVDTIFLAGSVGFDASMHEMWLNFLNGKKGCIVTKSVMLNPSEYKKLLEKYENTIAIFTTQLFHKYANYNPEIFKNVKYLVAGGDIMLSQYANNVKKVCKYTTIINIYGPTECSAATTTYEITGNEKNIPIGKPISNSRCYILDDKMRLLPIGCEGKLWIAGDGVGAGYINNKEVTKKSFVYIKDLKTMMYDSGDIVKYKEDGNILFIGRKDFQLKINGYRIEKGEIQNTALQLGEIDEVYIKIIQENDLKDLVMYITCDHKVDIEKLKIYMCKKIPSYMVPQKIMQIDKMPLKLNGKVDESKLPKYINENLENKNENISELEKFILDYYKNILNVQDLNSDSDLFDYGLDSLKIAVSIMMFNDNNINNIGYQDIFDLRTVKNIVRHINGNIVVEDEKYFKNYNYNNIDNLLEKNKIIDEKQENIKNNILLTGATGFLGAHILYELLKSTNVDIYCIVRHTELFSEKRLKEKFEIYFDKKSWIKYKDRIKVIDCNLSEINNFEMLTQIIKDNNINLIINSAAFVKHYSIREMSYKMNVKIVENLIELANITNSKLVHISTLSVSGNSFEGSFESQHIKSNVIFDEKKIFIGQNLKNVYTYTKYVAEIKILNAILDKKIDGFIIRVGNLTNSTITGKNQINIEDNGFVQRIKFLIDNKMISKTLYNNLYLEFSPVNLVAESIKILISLKSNNIIYHLFNNNHLKLNEFIKIYNKYYNEKITVVDDDVFIKNTKRILKSKKVLKYSVLVEDFKNNKENIYQTKIKVVADTTNCILKNNNFKWPKITNEYVLNFINNIYELRGGNSDS